MFIVYILFSPSFNRYYIGFTGDTMTERLAKHLSNHNGFTSKAKDWVVVYTETYTSKSEAMQREKQLKSWKSHQRIMQLIKRSSTE
jgi:putative endonuclease